MWEAQADRMQKGLLPSITGFCVHGKGRRLVETPLLRQPHALIPPRAANWIVVPASYRQSSRWHSDQGTQRSV